MSNHANALEQVRRVIPTTVSTEDLMDQDGLFERFRDSYPFHDRLDLGTYAVMEAFFLGSITEQEIGNALRCAHENGDSPSINNWTRVDLKIRALEAKGLLGATSREELVRFSDLHKRLEAGQTLLAELSAAESELTSNLSGTESFAPVGLGPQFSKEAERATYFERAEQDISSVPFGAAISHAASTVLSEKAVNLKTLATSSGVK